MKFKNIVGFLLFCIITTLCMIFVGQFVIDFATSVIKPVVEALHSARG